MSNNNFTSKVLWRVQGYDALGEAIVNVWFGTKKAAYVLYDQLIECSHYVGSEPERVQVPHQTPEALANWFNQNQGKL